MKLLIGPLAKHVRQEMGLKQNEVARRIDTSTSNLCRFEQGQQNLSPLLLNRLMTALNTNLDTLTLISSAIHQSGNLDLASPHLTEAQLSHWKALFQIVGVNNNPP